MSRTTITADSQDMIVETVPQDHALIISTKDGVIHKCLICAGTKDVYYRLPPTAEDMLSDDPHCSGLESFPMEMRCRCNAPNHGGDTYKLLKELHNATFQCRNILEMRKLLAGLVAQEEMR